MLTAENRIKDPLHIAGLVLIVISFLFFLVPVIYPSSVNSTSGGMFIVNFGLVVGYFLVLVVRGIFKRRSNGLHHIILFLVLSLISAYSLNREMAVFETSVDWFTVLLVVICFNYILFVFFERTPSWLKYLFCAIAGIAMAVFFYLSVYLLPIYPVSIFVSPALGISLHSFVPLLFCIYTVVLIRRVNRETKKYWIPFLVGIGVSAIVVISYAVVWSNNLRIINKTFRYASITANDQLPSWVRVAQRIRKNAVTEKILKTNLVYAVPESGNRDWFWGISSLNFENRAHDPLVMIGSFFSGPVNVPKEDRIKILESMYDSRHQAEERLWSGKDLITEHVSTNVELWPALRIAYTELNVTISHVPDNLSWTSTQEAIYTFHLPEGGVVTSLSLWINGKEEKGILTTKSKADSAYKTIVGVESRDPSVVHWQEGNLVSVRVFPVLKGESRKFKLGITSPLSFRSEQLQYENIYFDGPSFDSAEEEITIHSSEALKITEIPAAFVNDNNRQLSKHTKKYTSAWSLSFSAPPVSSETFTFNELSYSIKPVRHQAENIDIRDVFLDINASWSAEECERIYNLAKERKVYVSTGEETLKELTAANKQWIFDELRSNNFSLFPFHKIKDISAALVVSKSSSLSPTIDDLRKKSFIADTQKFFEGHKKIRLFDIGNNLSPYLKSLKEFRMLDYFQGDERQLEKLLSENIFSSVIENENEVAVDNAGISIHCGSATGKGNAPDHLMRLYAYNHILQRSGSAILADALNEEPLIKEAEEAYVVSPFSSLVVLETQADYDRFNIAASKNSLQNASAQSKGAVPEPHEWALIILVVLLCVAVKFYPRLVLIRNK